MSVDRDILVAAESKIDELKLRNLELLAANNREVENRRRYRQAVLNIKERHGAASSSWVNAVIDHELKAADDEQKR